MKWLLIFSTIVVVILVIALWLLQPMTINLAYYLWWRTTAAATEGNIVSREANIHYVTYGSGLPILLLHGGLSHRLIWFSQVPWLVNSGRQVILLDTRGHGESELGDSELSYRLLAADTIQVLNQLGIQKTDIIGWSDGANTAMLLALDWPQRVQRIIAVSGNSDPSGLTLAAQVDGQVRSSGLTHWFYRWWTGAGDRLDQLETRIRKLWQTSPQLKSVDLRKIDTPVLVIVGEHDLITLDHAEQMARSLPKGQLSIIPDGGHMTIFTRAPEVNRLIGNFLDISTYQHK
ncbi:Pimeloyl-ACP methyl ester carboxylesterase [Desulfuromusa kysingii]|uniref:Pimeloyl-ACP methyl ester carboxylesterase n=1 Tax=Desulfuromusa kysingii TaxID=37625 RepID=A0A1H3W342_9BACT|nr:alpha/beta hydrolase [Desulfuromusa kysingii]SDZ80824.1 Pimeloyl-ACP methyl ester carboxylesterase [Desulfuromusa kysingii]